MTTYLLSAAISFVVTLLTMVVCALVVLRRVAQQFRGLIRPPVRKGSTTVNASNEGSSVTNLPPVFPGFTTVPPPDDSRAAS